MKERKYTMKKTDWQETLRKNWKIVHEADDMALRYLELYFETWDELYWEAYKSESRKSRFYSGIINRMYRKHFGIG